MNFYFFGQKKKLIYVLRIQYPKEESGELAASSAVNEAPPRSEREVDHTKQPIEATDEGSTTPRR